MGRLDVGGVNAPGVGEWWNVDVERPVGGGEGGNVGEPKLPGGGCVGVHPIADGLGCVGGGGGVWWMGC